MAAISQLALYVSLVVAAAPGAQNKGRDGGAKMTGSGLGRVSIDAALDKLYPNEKDYRFGLEPAQGEASAPLAEVVVFRAKKPTPHWLYVTYGLTELDSKTSSDAAISGFGVEYTIRLADDSAEPPRWPINLLRWLAGKVWETRQPYDPGHSMNLPNQMLEKYSAGIEGLAFFEDEQISSINSINGKITFATILPLMQGEYELIGNWDAFKLAKEVIALNGDALWRPGRVSLLKSARANAISERVAKEGSSQSVDFYEIGFTPDEILLDEIGVKIFKKFLVHRVAHGRDAKVLWNEKVVQLEPGDWAYTADQRGCKLRIPPKESGRLAAEIKAATNGSTLTRPGGVRLRVDRAQ